jgi:uncharacterized protein YlzI (FlbEa/FlbD family)
MIARIGGLWLNPDHVTQVVSDPDGSCTVYLLAGPPVHFPNSADEVAAVIMRHQ